MATPILSLSAPSPFTLSGSSTPKQRLLPTPPSLSLIHPPRGRKSISCSALKTHKAIASALLATGFVSSLVGPAFAASELPFLGIEPSNALSSPLGLSMSPVLLSGLQPWLWFGYMGRDLGLKLGRVCLGAWKTYVNWSIALVIEMVVRLSFIVLAMVLVAIQAALTLIGNATMCFAAYRIDKSQEPSETS